MATIDRRGIAVDGSSPSASDTPDVALAIKLAARAATTANITLSGQQTIDGVAVVAGNRVLVKNQTDAKLNGIYVVSTGVWTRAVDFDASRDIASGVLVAVAFGTLSAKFIFQLATADPIVLGVSNLSFVAVSGGGSSVTPAALTSADDTNVTVSLGGTPAMALLQATSITLGWTGTLAAGRLNSNVVQAITNDTNVTGSISAQILTLGWTGVLGLSRGGSGKALTASNGGIVYTDADSMEVLAGNATAGKHLRSGTSAAPSWSSATWPTSTVKGALLYSTATNIWAAGTTAVIGENGVAGGRIDFQGSVAGFVGLRVPSSIAVPYTFDLPDSGGTSGQFLKTDGTGITSWGTPGRELLTAARTYYVRSDGSDSNNGLANTSGGAFLTVAKAIDVACALDDAIYDVTIQVQAGTWTTAVTLKNHIGAGTYILQGDTTTPSNVILSTTSASCINGTDINSGWTVRGFKIQTTTLGNGIALTNSKITASQIEFGAMASGYSHCNCSQRSFLNIGSNYTISGNAAVHWNCTYDSIIFAAGLTVTLSGSRTFSYFAQASNLSQIVCNNNTFSGSGTTAIRYNVTNNSIIDTLGAGATYLPGNSNGTTPGSGNGLYV